MAKRSEKSIDIRAISTAIAAVTFILMASLFPLSSAHALYAGDWSRDLPEGYWDVSVSSEEIDGTIWYYCESVSNRAGVDVLGAKIADDVTELIVPSKLNGKDVFGIADDAFYKEMPQSVKRVVLPPKLIEIRDWAFRDCTSLASVEFPAELRAIGDSAFSGCSSLTGLDLSKTKLSTLGESAFDDCVSLDRVVLGSNSKGGGYYEEYPSYVFANCTSLKTVDLGGWWVVGDYWFKGCTALEEAKLPGAHSLRGSAFEGCVELKSVTIGPKVTRVFNDCFKGCKKLASVKGAKGVTHIKPMAFQGCESLKSFKFSSKAGLVYIEKQAFVGCKKLSKIKFGKKAALWMIGPKAFQGCKALKTLKVPAGSKLTKKRTAKSLSGSSIKTVTVPAKKLANYRKLFSKANSGKKVTIK